MISPTSCQHSDISTAWAETFLSTMESGGGVRHPAMVIVSGLERGHKPENAEIRARLDKELSKFGENSCETVAGTIFPRSLWNPGLLNDSEVLYQRYEKAWNGIKKCPANRNGVYFRRLTAYQPKSATSEPVNQLEFISTTFRGGNHRKSALQAAILDPTRDHTNNWQKGFPCLQQVSFTPLENNKLSVTGFYATQFQFEKAYGNYLGLYWLGKFMSKQLGLTLSQVVCTAAVLERGNPTKTQLLDLASDLREILTRTNRKTE